MSQWGSLQEQLHQLQKDLRPLRKHARFLARLPRQTRQQELELDNLDRLIDSKENAIKVVESHLRKISRGR